MTNRTFPVRHVVDEQIEKFLDWLGSCYRDDPISPVLIEVNLTTKKPGPGINKRILRVWEQVKEKPHPPIEANTEFDAMYAGGLFFLFGDVRRVGRSSLLGFEWNKKNKLFIMERTGKTEQQLFDPMVINPTLTPEMALELGIATERLVKPVRIGELRIMTG